MFNRIRNLGRVAKGNHVALLQEANIDNGKGVLISKFHFQLPELVSCP